MPAGSDDALVDLVGRDRQASYCTFPRNRSVKGPASLATNHLGKFMDHIRSARSPEIS